MKINSHALIVQLLIYAETIYAVGPYLCPNDYTVTPERIEEALKIRWDYFFAQDVIEDGVLYRRFPIKYFANDYGSPRMNIYSVVTDEQRNILRVEYNVRQDFYECKEI